MKRQEFLGKRLLPLFLALLLLLTGTGLTAVAQPLTQPAAELLSADATQREIPFNTDWKFALGSWSGAQKNAFDDAGWEAVDLPHDWSIYFDFNLRSSAGQTAGFLDGGEGWYRKTFSLPQELWGKRFQLEFDGSMYVTTVFVNGVEIGKHFYGYTSFGFDITNALRHDGSPNVIAVRVENTTPTNRWYSGSGLYREVHMVVTDSVRVARHGVAVTTPTLEQDIKSQTAKVRVETVVENTKDEAASVSLLTQIVDSDGKVVAEQAAPARQVEDTLRFEQEITLDNPRLWSLEDPYLYTVVSTVLADGRQTDCLRTETGFRYLTFDSQEGFSLNGVYTKQHGMCMHHDLGAIGSAANYRATQRQLEILKGMGVNAIRTSHNPVSSVLIDLCNEMGFLVLEEAFDSWNIGKVTNDYNKYFNVYAEQDIKEMVNRDKNAPCVIMWSIGNEIPFDSNAVNTAKNLVKWVKEVDTSRPTTIGEARHNDSTADKILDIVDIAGYNYPSGGTYDNARTANPDWVIYGSETASSLQTRGVYYGSPDSRVSDNWSTRQCSSYDNHWVGWGSSVTNAWKYDRDRKFVLGQYVWTGFDYGGEPTPYWETPAANATEAAKSSYFGIVDLAGFPKDSYYLYQSQWTKEPMVHLFPHWNWTEGQKLEMVVYSNVDTVELFLNGRSLGEKKFATKTTNYGMEYLETDDGKLYLSWSVPFEEGKLEAVAKRNGQIVARDQVETSGFATSLRLTPDRRVITDDGQDLSFITVDVVDSKGVLVPDADNMITFDVTGGGVIAGVDNGNPISLERHQADHRKAFNGKALLIVRSDKSGQPIQITATSPGLSGGKTTVVTLPAEEMGGEKMLLELETVGRTAKVGNVPTLPSTVTAYYSDDSQQQLPVVWDVVNPEKYNQAGSFSVYGTVTGIEQKAVAVITIIDALLIEPYSTVASVGGAITLPEKVNLVYTDGSKEPVSVVWEEIPAGGYEQIGTYRVTGTVTGFPQQAEASIRVMAATGESNVALLENAPDVTPVASYTNRDDSLAHVNDNIISYGNNPKNRWTNWSSTQRASDYIGLSWQEAKTIDRVVVHFNNNDAGGGLPTNTTLQYLDDSGQVQTVPGAQKTEESVSGQTGALKLTYTFPALTTTQVRVLMTAPADGKCICVTEMQAYAKTISANTDASLQSILVDGQPLEGFNSSQKYYSLRLPYGSVIPTFSATAGNNARVYCVPPVSLPGTVRFFVTSESGRNTTVYAIGIETEKAPLASVSLAVESSSLTEDDVTDILATVKDMDGVTLSPSQYQVEFHNSNPDVLEVKEGKLLALRPGTGELSASVTYLDKTLSSNTLTFDVAKAPYDKILTSFEEVQVVTRQGTAPLLPTTVTAVYDRGLSLQLPVVWEPASPWAYQTIGTFQVKGKVEGSSMQPIATVRVDGVVAVQNISTGSIVGEKPVLPDSIMVYSSDDTSVSMPVTWEEIRLEQYQSPGIITVSGRVEGIVPQATATIRVTDQYIAGQDISVIKNGYYLPKIEASFTSSGDKVEHLGDDIISFTENPKNRWTNWKQTPDETAWISYIFGMEEETAYYLDQATVYFFEDFGCRLPDAVTLQFWNGEGWVDVSNQREQKEVIAQDGGAIVIYSFDKVATSRIRFFMQARPSYSIAITEIKMYANAMTMNQTAKLSGILVNGQPLEGFSPDVTSYDLTVQGRLLPKITATAADNASVTLLPPRDVEGKAQLLVTSENGVVTNRYNIQLHQAPSEELDVDMSEYIIRNERFWMTIRTPKDYRNLIFRNELDNKVGATILSKSVNGDGMVTTRVEMIIGTAGKGRQLSVYDGTRKLGTITFDVLPVSVEPAILSVDAPWLETVNAPFWVRVITTSDLIKGKFYSESGKVIGSTRVNRYFDKNVMVCLYELSIGTAGSRTITFKADFDQRNDFPYAKDFHMEIVPPQEH